MKAIFFNRTIKILPVLILVWPTVALAAMTSSNYTIYADSISVGGVGLATSSGYSLEGTLGEPIAGISSSTSYEARAGFQSSEREDLSLTINTTNVALGELSSNSINSASVIVTVTSYALTGYSLNVGSVSGSITATVNDGEVSTGVNEYGFTVSGNDKSFSGDKAVVAGQAIAAASGQKVDSATTLTFKAARNDAATVGTYSQAITLQVSANF